MTDFAPTTDRKKRKVRYRTKLEKLLDNYEKIILVNVDNVGSNQMQKVRMALRGKAELLMGKNTIIRKVIRDRADKNPALQAILPYVVGNVGFVFTNADLNEVRKTILENKVPAAAKSNSIAPNDVFVPPGPTGLDPGQTAFFQALNIATKIARGSIEIISTVHLIRSGDKVSSSAVALLTKLNILPFFYGIKVENVYEEGCVYDAGILDLTEEDMLNKFFNGVNIVSAICLKIGYPTACSVPHSFVNAFKKVAAITLATETYTYPECQLYRDMLENPDAFKTEAAPAEGGAAAAEAKVEEPEEEEESEGGAMGMFGDEEGY